MKHGCKPIHKTRPILINCLGEDCHFPSAHIYQYYAEHNKSLRFNGTMHANWCRD
jgi:hypothetical protein